MSCCRAQDWVGHILGQNLPKTVVPLRRFEKGEKTREGNESQEGSRRTWKEREGNESQKGVIGRSGAEWSRRRGVIGRSRAWNLLEVTTGLDS